MTGEREKALIRGILPKLQGLSNVKKALVGLDGYIDKIQRPVKSQDKEGSRYFSTLTAFGERVGRASGLSAQVELFTQQTKPGGNAPIMAHSLARLGIKNHCLGTVGMPLSDPVFDEVHPDCIFISVGRPAETNALEFNDGKLILSELSTFQHLDWATVKERIDLVAIKAIYAQSHLLALVDWCNLPHATDIWRGILDDLVKAGDHENKHFFFDLADPTKKSDEEIGEVLKLISSFSQYGAVTLGLNENETHKLYEVTGRLRDRPDDGQKDLVARGQAIFKYMDISQLLIHPQDSCYLFTARKHTMLKGRVVEKPGVSTGGGDNFNAGFYFGLLHGFTVEESMILAMGTSGAYVQKGESPDVNGLKNYLGLMMH